MGPMTLRRLASPRAALGLVLVLGVAGPAGRSVAARAEAPATLATEADITRLTASVLEHTQLAHRPLDADLARTFLARYLDTLDGSRSLFLQSDAAEFAARSPTLAEAIHAGDTSVAQDVFRRYLQRLAQRAAYVTEALRGPPFSFTGHDVYAFDRQHAARPRDLETVRTLWRQQLRAEYLEQKLEGRRPAEIASLLARRYTQQLETLRHLHSDEVLDTYLDVLAHVYDPHSDYLGHDEMESFSIGMNLSLFGIGATLEEADGYCTILELVPGGPAARSGLLKVGDRIVAVAQPGRQPVDVMSMTLDRVVELIRGPKGTSVTLRVIPANAPNGSAPKTVPLVRDRIELEDEEAKASIAELTNGHSRPLRIGVIDLPSFYGDMDGPAGRSASADVARLLAKLKAERVRGIVLDLRDNPGGSLDEAIRVTGLFIPKGPVVQTREAQGDVDVESDTDPNVVYDGPLVVLTSRLSASASEILAGALQDYGRAIVVGDTSTFGKGTVQDVVPLGQLMDRIGLPHAYDPGALKVTIRKFYRPSGASTQLRGVASDIVLPSPSGVGRVGESTLEDALAWDSVAPATYRRMDRVRPYLDALRRLSARRVATDPALHDLQAQVARLGERLAAKSVSLNEAQRRAQRTKQAEERAALDRDERADAPAGPVTYPVTLANASSPGLPTQAAAPVDGSPSPPAVRPSADAPTDAHPGPADLILHEAERILGDYVDMLARPRSGAPG